MAQVYQWQKYDVAVTLNMPTKGKSLEVLGVAYPLGVRSRRQRRPRRSMGTTNGIGRACFSGCREQSARCCETNPLRHGVRCDYNGELTSCSAIRRGRFAPPLAREDLSMNGRIRHTLIAFTLALLLMPLAELHAADDKPSQPAESKILAGNRGWWEEKGGEQKAGPGELRPLRD
jgi:hypothetical protein